MILTGLGPLAVLAAALLAFYINWRTLKQRTAPDKTALEQRRDADANALAQKTAADSRAEWWRRTQWALDRALDEDEGTKALGLATLEVLAHSDLARARRISSCSTSHGSRYLLPTKTATTAATDSLRSRPPQLRPNVRDLMPTRGWRPCNS